MDSPNLLEFIVNQLNPHVFSFLNRKKAELRPTTTY